MTQSGSVHRDGFKLDFVREGSGTSMLIVGTPPYYQRAFPESLRSHFDIVFADVRFWVPAPANFDLTALSRDTYSDDIEAVRQAAGLERPIVVGHSAHGFLALEYARRYPGNTSGVVIVGTPPVGANDVGPASAAFFEQDADADRRAAHEQNLANRPVPKAFTTGQDFVDQYVANGALYWYDPTFDASPLWEGTEPQLETLGHLTGQLYADFHVEPLVAPLFVALGRYDYVIPYHLWDAPRHHLTGLHYRLYTRSGHTPPYEEPQQFTADLAAWAAAAVTDAGVSATWS